MSVLKWHRVTVIGCGLIGSSFALAIKRAGLVARLAGWDVSPAVLDEALGRGHIDEVDQALVKGDVSSSDLIYLAMPVGEIIKFLGERGAQVKPSAVITDAGSTKEEVCRSARAYLPKDRRFVGGHPVAGSHLRGQAHARSDLFKGASYVLTIDGDATDPQALAALEDTFVLLGAHITLMTPHEHDRAMALVSHLPQILSSALKVIIQDQPDAVALTALSGNGYRDMTRLAASSWTVWRDIIGTNPAEIATALDALMEKLAGVREELRVYSEPAGNGLSATGALFERSQQTAAGQNTGRKL